MGEVKSTGVFSRNAETEKHVMETLTADEKQALGMVEDKKPDKVEKVEPEKKAEVKEEEVKAEKVEEVKEEKPEKKVDTAKEFDTVFKLDKGTKAEENKAPLTEDERAEFIRLKTETETQKEMSAINNRLSSYPKEEADVINEGLSAIVSSDVYHKFNGFDADEKAFMLIALAEKRMRTEIEKVKDKLEAAKRADIEKQAKAKAQAEVEVKALSTAETKGNGTDNNDSEAETERKKWNKARKGDRNALDDLIARVKPING